MCPSTYEAEKLCISLTRHTADCKQKNWGFAERNSSVGNRFISATDQQSCAAIKEHLYSVNCDCGTEETDEDRVSSIAFVHVLLSYIFETGWGPQRGASFGRALWRISSRSIGIMKHTLQCEGTIHQNHGHALRVQAVLIAWEQRTIGANLQLRSRKKITQNTAKWRDEWSIMNW